MSASKTPPTIQMFWSTRQLVTMALMCAIGTLLSFIEFPLLPGVTWLKFDASNMPAMVAGLPMALQAALPLVLLPLSSMAF